MTKPPDRGGTHKEDPSKPEPPDYELRLYISGMSPKSQLAVMNIKRICEKYLEGHYHLEIIDIYQEPGRASMAQIIAVPTLVKERPPPHCKVIGDLSQTDRLLSRLDILPLPPQ